MQRHHIALLQESGHLPNYSGSHKIYACTDTDRTPSVLIHRALTCHIVDSDCSNTHAAVKLNTNVGPTVFVSMYLPDDKKPNEAFVDAIVRLDACLLRLGANTCRLVVAGDANTELAPCENLIGNAVSGTHMNQRAILLMNWAAKWDLAWTSTFSEQTPCWTFQHKSTKRKYTLDYVLSRGGDCFSTVVYDWDYNCDHRPISFSLGVACKIRRQRNTILLTTMRPETTLPDALT
jgi:hypothetical protein